MNTHTTQRLPKPLVSAWSVFADPANGRQGVGEIAPHRFNLRAASSMAASLNCFDNANKARVMRLRTAAAAQASFVIGSTLQVQGLRAASDFKTAQAGASAKRGGEVRVRPEGLFACAEHKQSFARRDLVIQQVSPYEIPMTPVERRRAVRSVHLIEAPMIQIDLPLMCRLDAPSIVAPAEVLACKTYREAVQLCWRKRFVRNMSRQLLAERAGLYASHVTCYLKDGKDARDLPGKHIKAFELACNNTAITQWLNLNAKLTCLEVLQWQGVAA